MNEWAVQLISTCELTPGTESEGELTDDAGNFVYRFVGDEFSESGFDTTCADGTKG